MNSENKFTIIGRLTKDPILRETEKGTKVTNICVACEREYKGKDGNKIVDVLDFNHCYISLSFTITAPGPFNVILSGTNINCFQGTDGSISSNIIGGTLPYSFLWNNSQTTQNISSLSQGNYSRRYVRIYLLLPI